MTQALWLLLVVLAVAPLEGGRSDSMPSDGPGCEAAFRAFLTRLDRANRAVLEPLEIERERTSYAEMLRQVASGGALPRQTLLDLAKQLEQREQLAVERLANDYRIRLNRTFRRRRVQRDRRWEAWGQVLDAWHKAGSPADQRDKLIRWLFAAKWASTHGTFGPLPEPPRFGAEAETVGQVFQPHARSIPVAEKPLARPTPAAITRYEIRRPARVTVPCFPEGPPADLPGTTPASTWKSPSHRITERGSVSREPDTPRPFPVTARQTVGPLSILGQLPAAKIPPALRKVPEADGNSGLADSHWPESTGIKDRFHRGQLPSVARHFVSDTLASHRWDKTLSRPPIWPDKSLSDRWEGGRPGSSSVPGDDRAALSRYRAGTRTNAVPAVTSPAIHVVKRRPPWADILPSAGQIPVSPNEASAGRTAESGQTGLPGPRPEITAQPPASPSTQINLDELAARIAGHNLALRALEAELDQQQAPGAEQLAPLLARLKTLAVRRNDVGLFYELLSPDERLLVGELESPRTIIVEFGRRISEARTRVIGRVSPGGSAKYQAEMRLLDSLSRALAELAGPR